MRAANAGLGLGGDSAAIRLKLAAWCRELGQLDAAASHLETALRMEPAGAAARQEQGALALARGQQPEALEAFERALALDPGRGEALLGKARALVALKRMDEAREWLDVFAGRSDTEPERSWLAGLAADTACDRVAAHGLFSHLKDHPRLSAESRAHAGARALALADDLGVRVAAIERMDLEQAVAEYARLNARAPGRRRALARAGRGPVDARPDRRGPRLPAPRRGARAGRAEELRPRGGRARAPATVRRGDRRARSRPWRVPRLRPAARAQGHLPGDGRTAGGGARRLRGGSRRRSRVRRQLGLQRRHRAQARPHRAGGRVDRALPGGPAREPGEAGGGRAPTAVGDHASGPGARSRACAAEPGRGLQLAQAGALAEALRHFDDAVAADPLLAEAWLNRATCLFEMSRFDDARRGSPEAEELVGPTSRVADGMAACLLRLGRGDEALRAYDRLLALQPRSSEALRGKARTLVGLGRPAEALPVYQRLLARAPEDAALAREFAEAHGP